VCSRNVVHVLVLLGFRVMRNKIVCEKYTPYGARRSCIRRSTILVISFSIQLFRELETFTYSSDLRKGCQTKTDASKNEASAHLLIILADLVSRNWNTIYPSLLDAYQKLEDLRLFVDETMYDE